jgi:hypothetical protein
MLDILAVPYVPTIGGATTATNAANLLNERLGRAAGFTTGQFVDFDLGSAKAVDTLALLATNFVVGDTVTWTAGAAPGAATYSSGALAALASPEGANRIHRQHLLHLAAAETWRYWRATIASASARTVGRAVLGKAFEPLEGRDYGWDYRVVDMGENQRSQTGLDDPVLRAKVLEYTWLWSGLTKDEAENAAIDLLAYAGTTRDVLFCGDYSAANRHNLIGYGKMTEPAIGTNYAEGWYELRCQQLSRLVLSL